MKPTSVDHTRRRLCSDAAMVGAMMLCNAIVPARAGTPNSDHGRVIPPVPVPEVTVRCADGSFASLAALMRGRATALHLMFTDCSTVCPIQGAIFQRLQSLLPDQGERRIQLLSLSVDPHTDTPAVLQAWLERFDARAGWTAIAPRIEDLDRLVDLFGQGRNAVENHATQVNLVDRSGELVWKSPQLPAADALAAILRKM